MIFLIVEYFDWVILILKNITTISVIGISSFFVIKQLWYKKKLIHSKNTLNTCNGISTNTVIEETNFQKICDDKIISKKINIEVQYEEFSKQAHNTDPPISSPTRTSLSLKFQENSNSSNFLIKNLIDNEASVLICFAGETGTSERFAMSLHKDLKRACIKNLAVSIDYFPIVFLELCELKNNILILLAATHGDGEPSDVSKPFYEWLHENISLTKLNYTVFALGDRSYDRYNAAGRYFDKRLKAIGASNIYARGESDASNQPELSFEKWKIGLVPAIMKFLEIDYKSMQLNSTKSHFNDYVMNSIENSNEIILSGEPYKAGTFSRQKVPFHMKNPYLAKIENWKELCNKESPKCTKSVLHIELDLKGSSIRYEPGDHLGVYASNDPKYVERIGKLLSIKLDQIISFSPINKSFSRQTPFPCPTTIKFALLYYLDINNPLPVSALRDLVDYATTARDRETLIRLSNPFDMSFYCEWILNEHRNIIAVLEDIPSLKPPISVLLEILPKLQCRYYSIASSIKLHPNKVHVTVAIIDGVTPIGRKFLGVCSNRLKSCCLNNNISVIDPCGIDWRVPIFIKKSIFKLPESSNTPLILICAGTGIAPFIGFLQHRKVLKNEKPNILIGDIMIFYGCQSEQYDYLYEKELKSFKNEGIISNLFVAFSRDQEDKIYVTHLMLKYGKDIWKYLCKHAKIYVCGDAANMSKDVHEAMHQIVYQNGGLTQEQSADYMKRLSSQERYLFDVWT